MKSHALFSFVFTALLVASPVRAEVKLPAIFSDHMVVQSGSAVAVWGSAAPAEEVAISLAGQTASAKAGADGKWSVKLGPLKATSEPRTLTARGKNTITVKDVLVGEVWLASGQSNMEMQISGKEHGSVDHAEEEIAAAKHPGIRMFLPETPYSIYDLLTPPAEAAADRAGAWRVCSPETAADFSALGYFFARDLHQQLGVPVGIVLAAVGGTPIEAWTSLAMQQAKPEFAPLLADWQQRLANYDPAREQQVYLEKKTAWLKVRAEAAKKGEPAPKAPLPFKNLSVMAPGGLFNGIIAPLVPYAMRGCIWSQGERNAAGPFTGLYGAQLRTLITDWRSRWGTDFYFAWIQLPGFKAPQKAPSEPGGWGVAVREGMLQTLAVPHTGMAITIDLGGETAGHPTNKVQFAGRLSLVVLHDVYVKPIPEWTGPLFHSAKREGVKMEVSFDHAAGLKFSAGELQGFAIAGSDQKFVWAKAETAGETVRVWSDSIHEPEAVRYAWAANPKCNLVNAAGIPASPFRTDDWTDAAAKTTKFPPRPLAETVRIGALEFATKTPPAGLVARPALGLVTVSELDGQVVHRTTSRVLETRATITPAGDYLVLFPEGDHYAKSKGEKMNTMMAYRSTDKGRTWQGPSIAFDIPYSQHGFIPFIPRGSKRLYAFGTQPVPGHWTWENGQRENAPIGFRWSDDDGRTWSGVQLIAPANDPEFRGMSVMRMAETASGAWLVGSHLADWSTKPFTTKQYLLRSEDQGKTWNVQPGARPNGWSAEGFNRMDEGRPLDLGGGHELFMSRTPQGHLFTAWSEDNGKSWTNPAPSTLVHPDAPPMVFPLSDGETLVAFHHNKVPHKGAGDLDEKSENMKVRSEIWAATSADGGHTWSEPRFVFANAAAPDLATGAWNYQCSYLDAFSDGGVLHLFLPHRWQQVLHLTIKESALATLPTMAQLQGKTAGGPQGVEAAPPTARAASTRRALDPLAPPLGLKTYRDLGITVDETMLARTARDDAPGALQKSLVIGAWVFPLFDKGARIKLTLDDARTLWSSYSKDEGRSWSEPRFVAAPADEAAFRNLEFRKSSGKSLHVTLKKTNGGKSDVWFREDDLCRLATAEDLRRAPRGRFVITSVPPGNHDAALLADSLYVGGDLAFPPAAPPAGYKVDREMGLLIQDSMSGQVMHHAQSKAGSLFETRAVVTPRGDYLVMIPDGQHANTPHDDANTLLGYRSSDQGRKWSGPFSPFGDQSKHHGGLPLIPKGGERMYVFETQRGELSKPAKGDKAVGFRTSDDDGHTWSPVQLIQTTAGKYFGGLGVIQMTETDAATWMIGFHHGRVLRGAMDGSGRQWTVAQPPEPDTLDELRILGLQGPNVLGVARTCEGHLWEMRSADDGKTWLDVKPTTLVQPDAPPMIFTLSDHQTLIALHHNRAVMRSIHEPLHSAWLQMPTPTAEEVALRNQHPSSLKDWVSRAEVWFSLSRDGGRTWSESRLLFANALAETLDAANPNYQCSYVDLFVDKGAIHLIIPHRWQRIVHLTFPEDKLGACLTRSELAKALPESVK